MATRYNRKKEDTSDVMKTPLWTLFLILTCISLVVVRAKTDEWYQECQAGECGYGGSGSSTCYDLNDTEECRGFALRGECKANSNWMHTNCRKSCGICVVNQEECSDLHSNCPQWAGELECFTNPAYTSRACRKSCWLCVNETELREQGLTEDEIQRRIRFSQTDFGLWQSIPQQEETEKVREKIQQMGDYMKKLENVGPGTLCNNQFHECAIWTFEKGCEDEMEFMLPHCSLACQFCDIIEEFHDCRSSERSEDAIPFGLMDSIVPHLFHSKNAQNLLEANLEDKRPGEWVLSLPKNAIWELPELETQSLLGILKAEKSNGLEWVEASAVNFKDSSTQTVAARSGRSAVCSSECRKSHPSMDAFVSAIAKLLQIDTSYLQSLEFVHYRSGERFATHHDFRLHDQWKHSGNRVLTVFIALQNPEKGGGFGFPDLDWMFVEKPQLLVWPNVGRNPNLPLERMKNEQLPVVEGELYGVYAWVRQYPYDEVNPCA